MIVEPEQQTEFGEIWESLMTPENIAQVESDWAAFGSPSGDDLQKLKGLVSVCLRWIASVGAVYSEVTGGQITDGLSDPAAVIAAYQRNLLGIVTNGSSKAQ